MIVFIIPQEKFDHQDRTDIEIRIKIEGASGDESEAIGKALRNIAEQIRPGVENMAFMIDKELTRLS